MKALYTTLVISLLTCLTARGQAPNQDYASNFLFSYITMENGLPNNFVDCIYKDSRGFMWIGSAGGGLLKHDGYKFEHFNYRSQFQLKNNFVRSIVEDNFGRLWIGTECGIDILNLATGKQDNLIDSTSILQEIFCASTHKLIKDTRGSIWAGTGNSVIRIEFDSHGEISDISKLEAKNLIKNPVTALYEFDGQMLAGINNVVYKLVSDGNDKLIPLPFSSMLKLDCDVIKCMVAKENELWIGTNNNLCRFNPATENLKIYRHSDSDPNSLSQNLISDLQVSHNGLLIVGTLKGLNFYDSLIDGFQHIQQGDGEKLYKTINCDFINSLFCDDKIIWIGTEAGGLNKMTKPMVYVKNYQHSFTNPKTISSGPVNSIHIDKDGNTWVGTIEGGLSMKQKDSDNFQHFTTADGLSHNSVSCIAEIDDTKLLLGTWGAGLTIFDTNTKKGILTIDPKQDDCPNIHFVGSVLKDSINNGFWIGSNNGIFFFSNETRQLVDIVPESINHRIHGCLGSIFTKRGDIYIGTSMGIMKIDPMAVKNKAGNPYKEICPTQGNRATNFLTKTTYFAEDSDGNIWIGTDGYGLVKLISDTEYEFLTTDNGLSNDIVCHIMEDNTKRLWISTNNGLCCYSQKSGRIACYFKQDGLCDNQFFWNGCATEKSSNKMYFGSLHGLIEIDNERSASTIAYDKVYLTRLSVNDQTATPGEGYYLTDEISKASVIHLHERDKAIIIEFSTMNYSSPASIVYQYRLKGFDNKWTTAHHARRMAFFNNLPSGNYVLQVRCATGSSDFAEITEIKVIVSSYFYKTWWFITLMCIIGIVLINFIIRWRVTNLKEQKKLLEEKVNTRTSALESKTEELSRQNEILYRQNEEISRQKNQMEKMTQKIQELTVDKLAFFTNITHEFRTPLTLIIGPIERALKLSTNPKVIEQLNFVNNNSKHLLSLVNQLMDFRKVESDNMPISLNPGNLQTFVEDVLLPFKALSEEHGIQIRSYMRISNPYIMFDKEAMTKILTNLLGNSLKFTPEGGVISLYVATIGNPDRIYVCVSDTGRGIVKEDIEKVFNSFYQSKNQDEINTGYKQGTGIGLYVCKRLANLLGGDILAKNNKGKGASFRLTVPLVAIEEQEQENSTPEYDESIDDQIPDDTTHQKSILVVEDNQEMRKFIKSILCDSYNVVEATDGKNALSILKKHQVDLILSDLMMPEMNGLELAAAVKKDINISHIPIIILTAKNSRDSQLESFRNGVDDYITKPFDEVVLLAKIQTLIDNRKKYQQRFINNMDVESLNISEDSSDKVFIDKAFKIIKDKYSDSEFEIQDLADGIGVSKTLLNKKMQALTKQSAGQFIRNYRLKIALELIKKNKITHNMNISEIAYEVGFNDPKYFTRCFTKHFGVTPSSVGENDVAAE